MTNNEIDGRFPKGMGPEMDMALILEIPGPHPIKGDEGLAPCEQILLRNLKRRLFFGHIFQVMEVTEQSIVLWRENSPLNMRVPSLTDVVVMNSHSLIDCS